MTPSIKTINYGLLQTLNNNITITQNDCFGNIVRAVQLDKGLTLCVGYTLDTTCNLCCLHGWLESENEIFEISLPSSIGRLEYYSILKLTLEQWNTYDQTLYTTIDSLLTHRYFSRKFINTQNYFSKRGVLFATQNGPQNQGLAKHRSFGSNLLSYIGVIEYRIKNLV